MNIRQALQSSSFVVGMLGALLALSVVLLHLPAAIYAGNVAEFTFGLSVYLAFGAALIALAMIGIGAMLVVLPARARSAVGGALCGIGIVLWAYGNLFLGDAMVLDGRHTEFRFDTWLGRWEPLIAVAVVAAIGLLAARHARPFGIFLVVLNVGLLLATAREVVRDPRLHDPLRSEDANGLFRFSTRGNVLLVLMDSLQADVFERIVRADADLHRALAGFTLYRDAVGVAPTTVISLPAMHSGRLYTPGQSVDHYYDENVRKGSFLNRLAVGGFETTLVNPIKNVCPEHVALCTSTALAIGEHATELQKSWLRLLDFAVLRVVPFAYKDRVYNRNRWLLSTLVSEDIFADNILMGNALLGALGSRAQLGDGPPTAKFVHLLNTHPPFLLGADCQTLGADSLENIDSQLRCALRAFVAVLERMKADGTYDAATVALVADHGYSMPSGYSGDVPPDRWTELVGSANPTFLVKLPGAHGGLAFSDQPVSLADVALTLCKASRSDCGGLEGKEATQASPGRSRTFTLYRWNHEWWQQAALPVDQLTHYAIQGPVWKRESWRLVDGHVQRYAPGTLLDFRETATGTPPVLSPFEWSGAEAQGTWVDGRTAHLVLKLDPVPRRDLDLEVDAYAFLPAARPAQHVQVLANGVEVGRWSFDHTDAGGWRHAHIPLALIPGDTLKLAFRFPDAVSPAALGLSGDTRTLSVGFRLLRVTERGATTDLRSTGPTLDRADAK